MNDNHDHPASETPGLKAGKGKHLVECDTIGATGIAPNDMIYIALFAIDTSGETFRPVAYADPATVLPASLLADLRAEVAAIDFAFGNCDALQGLSLPDKASKAMSEARAAQELRADLAASVAAANRNADWAMNTEKERDTARAELREALEWMRARMAGGGSDYDGRAILARHPQFVERRKGVPDRRTSNFYYDDVNLRVGPSDRRKASVAESPCLASKLSRLTMELEEAKAECERLRALNSDLLFQNESVSNTALEATTRAEQAKAKAKEWQDLAATRHGWQLEAEAKLGKLQPVVDLLSFAEWTSLEHAQDILQQAINLLPLGGLAKEPLAQQQATEWKPAYSTDRECIEQLQHEVQTLKARQV